MDGFEIAKKVGNTRTANVVLVGALSTFLPVAEETFIEVIRQRLPAKILDVNLQAFAEGRKISQ